MSYFRKTTIFYVRDLIFVLLVTCISTKTTFLTFQINNEQRALTGHRNSKNEGTNFKRIFEISKHQTPKSK